MIDRAGDAAKVALRRDECNLLLNPVPGNPDSFTFTAREVLATATTSFEPPPGRFPDAVASVTDVGRSSTIRIHPRFADLGKSLTLRLAGLGDFTDLSARPETPLPLSGDLLRAVTILHEVGHLTEREGPHEGSTVREALYNTRILNTCFAPRSSPTSE